MKGIKVFLSIGILFIIIIVIFKDRFIGDKYASDYQKSIYDDNGKIVDSANSFSYANFTGSEESGMFKCSFRFTGVDTFYELKSDEAVSVSINYNMKVSSGNLKLVIINPNNVVTVLQEGTGKEERKIEIIQGVSRLKIVGNDAIGKLQISVQSQENVKIDCLKSEILKDSN